jgi:hypothetical protein
MSSRFRFMIMTPKVRTISLELFIFLKRILTHISSISGLIFMDPKRIIVLKAKYLIN